MKIAQLSTIDSRFGAGIAARRLHEALLHDGVDSDFVVRDVYGFSPRTLAPAPGLPRLLGKVERLFDELPLRFYPQRQGGLFSLNWFPSATVSRVRALAPDLVHIHWCQAAFLSTGSLPNLDRPLVWTLHDMWAFTGGCHYDAGCGRYLEHCGRCPILNSGNEHDLSWHAWGRKKEIYARLRPGLQIICPSTWLAEKARQAPVLQGVPVHVIPNPLDPAAFRPINGEAARALFGLPADRKLVLFGKTLGEDGRKGFDLLLTALNRHHALFPEERIGLVTLGPKPITALRLVDAYPQWDMGVLQDVPALAALYNAVDMVVLPSRQENLSNMLAEALSCGTPCLAFAIGGNGDLVQHQINGYLARENDAEDLAQGLHWILGHLGEAQRAPISRAAGEILSPAVLLPRFLEVYRQAMAMRP